MRHIRNEDDPDDYDCDYIIDLGRKLIVDDKLDPIKFFVFVHRDLYPMVPYINW